MFFAIGISSFLILSNSGSKIVREPWFRNCDAIDQALDYVCESTE
jgi:hypothetical protein